MGHKIIAWDFDGVLNRNIVDGKFVWAANFDADLGASGAEFSEFVFKSGRFADVLVGIRDIRDVVSEWLAQSTCHWQADEVLDYWFSKDAVPDARSIALLERARGVGLTNVLATNNERRRASYIEHKMGFGEHVQRIFAAGPMGCKKPDTAFYRMIEAELGATPGDIFLVDDTAENVAAACAAGWTGFLFHEGDYAGLEEALFFQDK